MLNKELYDKFIADQIEKRAKGEEDLPMLTRTQNEWLMWLFDENSIKQIEQVGNLPTIFENVFKFIKSQ